jgi:hypothetical protein
MEVEAVFNSLLVLMHVCVCWVPCDICGANETVSTKDIWIMIGTWFVVNSTTIQGQKLLKQYHKGYSF